jgi:hypothetical membrane protein
MTGLMLVAGGLVVLDVIDPGSGPIEYPLSAHAFGKYAAMWNACVVIVGAVMLRASSRSDSHRRAARFLITGGIMFICVGVFTADPWYPWERMPTWRGWIHVSATLFSMIFFGAAMAREFVRGAERSRMLAGLYLATLAFSLVFTLGCVVRGVPVPLIGLEERILMAAALSWLATITSSPGVHDT